MQGTHSCLALLPFSFSAENTLMILNLFSVHYHVFGNIAKQQDVTCKPAKTDSVENYHKKGIQ